LCIPGGVIPTRDKVGIMLWFCIGACLKIYGREPYLFIPFQSSWLLDVMEIQ